MIRLLLAGAIALGLKAARDARARQRAWLTERAEFERRLDQSPASERERMRRVHSPVPR